MRRRVALLLILSAFAAGCASMEADRESAQHMSEAKRDTLLAKSSVPGASVVGRAMAVSGNQATRAAQMDSLPN